MKPKILTTARFIENLKRKVKRNRIKALCETDSKDRVRYERDATSLQKEADQMERAYSETISTADRKF